VGLIRLLWNNIQRTLLERRNRNIGSLRRVRHQIRNQQHICRAGRIRRQLYLLSLQSLLDPPHLINVLKRVRRSPHHIEQLPRPLVNEQEIRLRILAPRNRYQNTILKHKNQGGDRTNGSTPSSVGFIDHAATGRTGGGSNNLGM
jgi:hypothetical protein